VDQARTDPITTRQTTTGSKIRPEIRTIKTVITTTAIGMTGIAMTMTAMIVIIMTAIGVTMTIMTAIGATVTIMTAIGATVIAMTAMIVIIMTVIYKTKTRIKVDILELVALEPVALEPITDNAKRPGQVTGLSYAMTR